MKEKYCLLAIRGDMSHNGMGNKSEIIEVKEKHLNIVEEFLMAHTLFKIKNLKAYYDSSFFETEESRKAHNNYWGALKKLYQASIFEHKYQARTEWELCFNSKWRSQEEKSEKKEFYNKIEEDKDFAALHISERFGNHLPSNKLLKYDVYGEWLFFQCAEKYIFDNNENNIFVFSMSLNSNIGEVYDEYNTNKFDWNNLQSYVAMINSN
jgi:hypothetical protein